MLVGDRALSPEYARSLNREFEQELFTKPSLSYTRLTTYYHTSSNSTPDQLPLSKQLPLFVPASKERSRLFYRCFRIVLLHRLPFRSTGYQGTGLHIRVDRP